MVLAIEFFGEPDMLVYGSEPTLDVLVLGFVEVLKFLCFGGGFVGGDGSEAIAFPGGVGADGIELIWRFELGGEVIRVGFAVVVEGVLDVGG